jgi:hypothetical protein
MKDWFLERQTRIAFIFGLVCILAIVAASDQRWPQAIASLAISLVFIFFAQRLYCSDTTENWLRLSYGEILKNVLSGVVMLIGWTIFLRLVFGLAIGAVLLWLD